MCRQAEDIQQLIESINTYRNEAATDELRRAFCNDVDPNGNPYGYDTLTGQRSNNMQHGVTWSYANGIYNDTAEIISMAAGLLSAGLAQFTRACGFYGRRAIYPILPRPDSLRHGNYRAGVRALLLHQLWRLRQWLPREARP